ncbi:ribosomal protein L4 [Ramicandelaber brevisporus]|nr:ribosomal protein L4 [Ramicandelaber brevisporus]KAI8869904.1 ribosomal protein L4 [Ramicandelaber brevisporus]
MLRTLVPGTAAAATALRTTRSIVAVARYMRTNSSLVQYKPTPAPQPPSIADISFMPKLPPTPMLYGKQPTDKALPSTVDAWLRNFETFEPLSVIPLSRRVFAAPLRTDVLHRVVVYERNAARQGTHAVKNRSQVSGRTGKAFQQKGRGKARVGSLRAPHFRGGGVAHGPVVRSHATKIQRKVWDMGLRVALSAKYAQDQLIIVDKFEGFTELVEKIQQGGKMEQVETPKTKLMVNIIKRHPKHETMVFMTLRPDNHLELAARNINTIKLMQATDAEVYQIMSHKLLIMDREAAEFLQKRLEPL